MKFEELLRVARGVPVFHTGLLLAGDVDPADVQRQLVRWTTAGRVIQLRRGLYTLAPTYRSVTPEPFLVANELLSPSYVSCQSALAYHGLIPESVPNVVSVTTRRTAAMSTPLGTFRYRHVRGSLFNSFERVRVAETQYAFVATAEKALLDLVYLEPGADQPDYLEGLRLQHLESDSSIDVDRLMHEADRSGSPKLRRAAALVARMARTEAEESELS